ncbi:MAG: hypothetical protein K5695_10375 [Oscillospiraceae bacterium]|nr:hypothetical protein [Oscillospiraceae bacterium]
MKRKKKKQNPKPSKAKILCVVMTASFAVLCLLLGIWQTRLYTGLKNSCTSEITGIVTDTPKNYSRFLRIRIGTDGETSPLKSRELYVKVRGADEGDRVRIHYAPAQPDAYYISDVENVRIMHLSDSINAPRSNSIFAYGASGFMFAVSLFLIFLIRKSMQT